MRAVRNAVFVVDMASKQICDANDGAVALTGYAKDELRQKTFDELSTPDTVSAIFEDCAPQHSLDDMPVLSKVGAGSLLTNRGIPKAVELYCQFAQSPNPTVLIEARPLDKRP